MKKKTSAIREAEAALRKLAFSLPGSYEDFPWGESVAKVRKKVFVFFGTGAGPDGFTFSVKLPESGEAALDLPFTEPTGYGLGKHDWVTVTLSPKDEPPLEILKGWLVESYRAVAPAKLVGELREPKSPSRRTARSRSPVAGT